MKNYKWIIVGVILGICFLIPFFLKGINIQQIVQSISNSEFNTIANYYFSTVAQTMAAIMGFLIASVFAVIPIINTNNKPEFKPLSRSISKEPILKQLIYSGLCSTFLSILSLFVLYVSGNSNYVALFIIIIGIVILILVLFSIYNTIIFVILYLPAYFDPRKYLELKNAFKRNNLSEEEIIEYISTCLLISSSKPRLGIETISKIISKQDKIDESSIDNIISKIVSRIHNDLFDLNLDSDEQKNANIFYYIVTSEINNITEIEKDSFDVFTKNIIYLLQSFRMINNKYLIFPFYELFDLLGIPFEKRNKGKVKYDSNSLLKYSLTWIKFCAETMKSNYYLFLVTNQNLLKFVFKELASKEIITDINAEIKTAVISVLFMSNIHIALYLYNRIILKYNYFEKFDDIDGLVYTFDYNNSKLVDMQIDMSLIERLITSKEVEPNRNVTRILNTIILFLDQAYLREHFVSQLSDSVYLCNIDFELYRLILEIQNKIKIDDNRLFNYIFETIKVVIKDKTNIPEPVLIKYLNISKSNSSIFKYDNE